MNMEHYLGIGSGLMALGSFAGIFSPQVRKWAWRRCPFSSLTSGLYFLAFSQMSLLMFGVFDGRKIYTIIPVITAISLAASIGTDYYRADRKVRR